jgi:hypothetical protein
MLRLLHIPMAVLVFALLAPVVICVVPGTALNAGSDCCEFMSAGCDGTEQLSACCAITVSDALSVPAGRLSADESQEQNAVMVAFPIASEVRVVQQSIDPWISSSSPPPLSPSLITVLRV